MGLLQKIKDRFKKQEDTEVKKCRKHDWHLYKTIDTKHSHGWSIEKKLKWVCLECGEKKEELMPNEGGIMMAKHCERSEKAKKWL